MHDLWCIHAGPRNAEVWFGALSIWKLGHGNHKHGKWMYSDGNDDVAKDNEIDTKIKNENRLIYKYIM